MSKSKQVSSGAGSTDPSKILYCNFCGKSQYEVRKLIAGPNTFICNECVELCNDIVAEENRFIVAPGDSLPEIIRKSTAKIEEFVPGNSQLKKDVALDAAGHMFAVGAGGTGARACGLFLGPIGCGISEILKVAWEAAGANVLVVDASQLRETSLSETSNVFAKLVQSADYNYDRAQRGTIIIENIDRLADGTEGSRRLQEELEVLIRGTLVNIPKESGRTGVQREQPIFDTSNVSFYATSSVLHRGCPSIVADEDEEQHIDSETSKIVALLEARGFLRELILSFDVIREYRPIGEKEFEAFLKAPTSKLLAQWRSWLGRYSAGLEQGCMAELLIQVKKRESGLRALQGVLRLVAMRVAFERHNSDGADFTITPEWLRDNL